MRSEGISVPELVLFAGISNGPPATMGALKEELDEHRSANACVDPDSHFSLRWVSTQLQITGHDKLGYWSWMEAINR